MANAPTFFSGRWGLMLALLGMAVGTGNIWRFPRIAATQGGGSFLIAWVIFLFLWSVPLIVAEFAMGKALRRGPLGTFAHFVGERFAFMGTWVAWIVAAIGFYYAAVMGWTIRFLIGAVGGQLGGGGAAELWGAFAFSPWAVAFQGLAVLMGAGVVYFGVAGIERIARVLMPTLVVIVFLLAARALTLPGAERGLAFLFTPDWRKLGDVEVWLSALAQNAWDTGAGWGLVLAYAVYSRRREDTNLNSFLLAFGNNSISLLAGILVLCTIFSQRSAAAEEIVGAGNEGLTFIWVPRLFDQIPGGSVFMVLFFLALVFAAWTSLVATFEVGVRFLVDLGFRRRPTVIVFSTVIFLAGVPSALVEDVFRNQDFVWSVGLMIAGLFFALAVLRYGARRFRREFVNTPDQDFHLGTWWEHSMRLIVVQAAVLIVWMFYQNRGLPLMNREGLGNMLLQWTAVLAAAALLNRWLVARAKKAGLST